MKMLLWLKAHKTAAIVTAAVIAVVALTLGLSLGLTLPIKSVTASGEVTLLTGEDYTEGISLTVTTRAGKEAVVPVTADMITGFDPAVRGLQDITITYKGRETAWKIRTLANEDLALCVRDGTMPQEYEPKDPFPTSGIFDLYYNDSLFLTRAITEADAPGFTTRLSGSYDIMLYYREGLGVPYHYTVPEIVDSIEVESGVLFLPQGKETLSKSDVAGDMRFLVKYKDGTEKYVWNGDDQVDVRSDVLAVDPDQQDYEIDVSVYYKGFSVTIPATAYYGDLFKPGAIDLRLEKTVYAQGETFDYASARIRVELNERFDNSALMINEATQKMVFLAEWQGAVNGEGGHAVPITDGSEPIRFDEVKNYSLIACYNSVYSTPVSVLVVSKEESTKITSIETNWNGSRSGPPKKGEDLDYTDAELTVVYGRGYNKKTLDIGDAVENGSVVVTGYDKSVAGDQTLVITYTENGQDPVSIKKNIRIPDPNSNEVTGIVSVIGWDEPTFFDSPSFVVPQGAYLEVEIGYGGQENGRVYFYDENDNIRSDIGITGTIPPRGEGVAIAYTEITITYAGFETKHSVTIQNRETRSVIMFEAPWGIEIFVEDELDLSGQCTVYYSDNNNETITLAELFELAKELNAEGTMQCEEGKEFNNMVAGDYKVWFYYPGFDKTDHATYVYVRNKAPVDEFNRIELDVTNAKTVYKTGEELDISNMSLYLVYTTAEGERKDPAVVSLSMFDEKNFDTSTPTEGDTMRNIIVQYYVDGEGFKQTSYYYRVVAE